MKALIRNPGETVFESYDLAFIDWNTGVPLTNAEWSGGPYTLVNEYVPNIEDDFVTDEAAGAGTQDPDGPVPVGDTIVIDGVTYTRTS